MHSSNLSGPVYTRVYTKLILECSWMDWPRCSLTIATSSYHTWQYGGEPYRISSGGSQSYSVDNSVATSSVGSEMEDTPWDPSETSLLP